MKTSIALLFTASVVTSNSGTMGDPSLSGLSLTTSAKPVSGAIVPTSKVDLAQAVAAISAASAPVELPVEVGMAAIAALPIVEATAALAAIEPASAPADAPVAIASLGTAPVAEAVALPVEAKIEAGAAAVPAVGSALAGILTPEKVAVAAMPALAETVAPQPAVDIVPQVAKPAAAGSAPAAPAYIFFDDASANAAAPVAMAASGAMYGSENVSLEQAISAALETNPEVNQAIMNKEAIEFEREQAQGLYLPRVDIEASAGIRRLENNTRRTLGIADKELYPLEAGIYAEQTIVDFGRRHGELMRQAARTDGAALRVAERSENIALLVTRQYLDILLQQRVVAAAEDNVTFHRNLVGDLGQGVQQGSISIADQQQAQERLQAAVVRKTEAEEALVNAQIMLQTLTGLSVNSVTVPASKRAAVTPTINDAIAQARQENPKVLEAMADVDAAHAMIEKANGDLYPTIGVEARGRVGEDIDGFAGETNDVQARVVLKWNVFDGGINRAKYQEMVRRASESRFRLHELVRYAEEDVRKAWNSMSTQDKVGQELEVQSRVSDDLLLSYREQFNVGRRSLLDVLDAQNTRYNVQVRLETARFAEQFAEYQVLAATNNLLETLGLSAPAAGDAYAREKYNYGPSDPAELNRRRYPR